MTTTAEIVARFRGDVAARMRGVAASSRDAAHAAQRLETDANALTEALDRMAKSGFRGGEAVEEAAQKLVDVSKKAGEFGATMEQAEQLLQQVADAAAQTGRPIALVARHMEELLIETQDAAKSQELFNKALAFSAQTGQRVEQSVAQLVDATRGSTAALRQFGAEGVAIASSIDQVADANERARLTMAALDRLAGRQRSTFDRLNQGIVALQGRAQAFIARLGPLGKALGVLTAVGLGAAAAIGGTLLAAFKKTVDAFGRRSKVFGSSVRRLSEEWDKFKASIGSALLGGTQGAARSVSALSRFL